MDNFVQDKEENVCQNVQTGQTQEKIKQTKQQLFWEIFRFLLVGGIATVADYITYYFVREWIFPASLIGDTLSLVIAIALGFAVGLIVNWLLSVSFVYRQVKDEKAARSKKSFVIFTIIGVIGLGITELGVWLLVQKIIPEFTFLGVKEFLLPWNEWVAKVVMTCIVLVFNYVGRKLFIFKS